MNTRALKLSLPPVAGLVAAVAAGIGAHVSESPGFLVAYATGVVGGIVFLASAIYIQLYERLRP